MVLWSKSSILDEINRKFEGSRPAANSFFGKWTTIDARNKEKIWRRKKRKTKNKRARERTTIDARASKKSLDPKLLSVNKRLNSKDVCGVNDHRRVKHFHLRELRVEERKIQVGGKRNLH